MSAKKALINSPDTVVVEAIEGLVACHPHLARLDGFPEVRCRLWLAGDPTLQ